jgi:hypothetical protein
VIEMPADPDYIDILNCYNEAMEKAKKDGKSLQPICLFLQLETT